jgi:hypothetical protein
LGGVNAKLKKPALDVTELCKEEVETLMFCNLIPQNYIQFNEKYPIKAACAINIDALKHVEKNVKEMNRMIENNIEGHETLPKVIELHYGTGYNFSKKLLSTFLRIRHPGLEVIRNINDPAVKSTCPTVPLMNIIHDHKPTLQHDRAFVAVQHAMKEHAPNLRRYPKISTSDRFQRLGKANFQTPLLHTVATTSKGMQNFF